MLEWPPQGRSPAQRENRKLAAILAADIAGYSRLIGKHEEGTLHLEPIGVGLNIMILRLAIVLVASGKVVFDGSAILAYHAPWA